MTDRIDAGTRGDTCCPRRDRDHDWLRRQVNAAIDEIAALRCPDPAAMDAFLAARLALHTLREMWLPNI